MSASPRRVFCAALVVALVVALAPTAVAGPPGKWTKVTDGTVVNYYEPGLFRTPDRVLHVAFARAKGGTDGYGHTAINKAGKQVGSIGNIFGGWDFVAEDPVLLDYRGGDGIRLVFSGQTGAPYNTGAMYTATSTDTTGTAWNIDVGSMSKDTHAYSSSGIAATNDGTGTPMATWTYSDTVLWHRGVDASNPAGAADGSFDTNSGSGLYNSAMAADLKTGDVWVAWYSLQNANADKGTWVKKVYPSAGGAKRVPNSVTSGNSVNFGAEVAMAPRRGGGVYTATCVGYPTCTKLQLWKVGTTKKWSIPQSAGATDVTIATAPQGRMWIAWVDPNDQVRAVRTNTSATGFGPVRNIGRPAGATTLYQIAGEGSTGRMDVVVNVGNAMWHTQVLAALSMTASPKTFDNAKQTTVKFVVRDAGQPVKGAKVSMGGKSARTNNRGVAFLTFPKGFKTGKYKATARKAGYYPAMTTVKVN